MTKPQPELCATVVFLGAQFAHVFEFAFRHYKKGEVPNRYFTALPFGFHYWFEYKKRDR
jgi:hypothetical protein